MALRTSFFEGNVSYYPSDFHAIFRSFMESGRVNTNDLWIQATSTPSMNVEIQVGSAFLYGQFVYNDSVIAMPINPNISGLGRIDSIILEINNTTFTTVTKLVKGTPNASPIAPALQSNQLLLANIVVNNGVSAIYDGDIKNNQGKLSRISSNEFVAGDTLNTEFSGLKAIRKTNGTVYKSVFGASYQSTNPTSYMSLEDYGGNFLSRVDLGTGYFAPYNGYHAQIDLGRDGAWFRNAFLSSYLRIGNTGNANYVYSEYQRSNSTGLQGRIRTGINLLSDLPTYGIDIAHNDSNVRTFYFNRDEFSCTGDNVTNFGNLYSRWKDGYFGGTVYANGVSSSNDNTVKASAKVMFESNSKVIVFDGVAATTEFRPSTLLDNTINNGSAAGRWKNIYAGTGTINTSDRNYKQQIAPIEDTVLDAWSEVNYCKFKFNDAVVEKGEEARFHIGVIAQDIEEAFAKHNLNAFDYGILGKDLRQEDGNYIYSIRADECQFLELALQRRETQKLKEQLQALLG